MIKVFNGEWRGLGEKERALGMIIGFNFREILGEFKGARLAVFMAIALHANEDGLSFPSYDLLEKETGYTRASIASAIDELCEMVIEGQRVMMRYRERDAHGHYTGSNRYRIFPTVEELNSDQSLKIPTVENPNGGKTKPEVKPSVKDKPSIKKNQLNTGGAKPPDPAKEKRNLEVFEIAQALASVTGMDFEKNRAQILKEAKHFKIEDLPRIHSDYSAPSGAWYRCDWRGKNGERPALYAVRQTFGNLNGNGKSTTPQSRQEAAAAAFAARRAKNGNG